MTLTAQDIVSREVHYCVSSLVATLAAGRGGNANLRTLCEQAFELAMPVDDWEEAAIQAGFKPYEDGIWHGISQAEDPDESRVTNFADAEEVCREEGIDPYQSEVYEHWIVSDWLADKLEAAGEKVDRDFAGMTVWARTTTGQAIYADSVFETIAAELAAQYPA